jgi:NADH-quinone oxidoreductase subunit N
VFAGAMSVGLAGAPELVALAIIGVVNSVISVYYYFNVVRAMFFQAPAEDRPISLGFAMGSVVAVLLVLTLAVIVFAKPFSCLTLSAVYASAR